MSEFRDRVRKSSSLMIHPFFNIMVSDKYPPFSYGAVHIQFSHPSIFDEFNSAEDIYRCATLGLRQEALQFYIAISDDPDMLEFNMIFGSALQYLIWIIDCGYNQHWYPSEETVKDKILSLKHDLREIYY